MAAKNQGDIFDAYFRRADLDGNGEISGVEAVAFFQAANLSKQVLAQIWNFADQNRRGSLGRPEFYNALKLVTVAQRKHDLTPDIVKAALFGQASARIPAPQINLAALPTPSASQMAHVGSTASQTPGVRPALLNTTIKQQYSPPPGSGLVRPPSVFGAATSPVQGAGFPGFPAGAPPLGSNLPTVSSALSSDAGVANAANTQTSSYSGTANSPLPNHAGILSGSRIPVASLPSKSTVASGLPSTSTMQPRPQVTQNGFASGPRFGGDTFPAAQSQSNIYGSVGTSSASSAQVSSPSVPISSDGLSAGRQHLKMQQSHLKKDAQNLVPSIRPFGPPAVSPQASTGHQQQLQWPRVTQTDIQKYTKVFIEVDTDKDGKITGDQARNLFLSWRLPIEVLKQVWNLSDQDNDSMLSVREFCIALYLMERHREGRPLPAMLPSSVMLDFPATAQPVSGYGKSLVFSAGFQQPQGPGASQRPSARPPGKPPLPIPAPSSDDRLPPKPQKAKVPVLDKHLVDQLSEEEQKSLNLKFQEASEANKKVEDLEKEIKESREKMEFYRVKMQELVLYKSRCDSRLNEVTERAATDKREVDSLAKKYEEKYLQTGNVASKLTIEEATFRDIQERKMEMYRAVVKMEQDGSGETLQTRADHIQSSLEELVRSLSERCKKYGLRSKPTTLVELPFGWQTGIQEGVADWDEDWDKFEDEGFTFVKEMTLDVQNVIAPPKPKVKVSKKEKAVAAEGEAVIHASDIESKLVKPAAEDTMEAENGVTANHKEDNGVRSPVASPSAKSSHGSPRDYLKQDYSEKTVDSRTSPRSKQPVSNIAATDASSSGDKRSDKPAWGKFDTNDDADSFSGTSKVVGHERRIDDLFGDGQFTLPPIRTSSSQVDDFLPKKSIFADSVPGTPIDVFLPKKSVFDDSVPNTPAERFLPKHSVFADSVPSTPLGAGLEERGYNFSRFDSFRSNDSGFQPQERLSRFDSMQSRDFDSEDGGSFQQRETFSRFDSMRSTNDSDFGLRFSSFDDSDPLGSGAFKSSFGNETPRRDSDGFGGSSAFETPRSEVDRFGSVGPFRSSLASETPGADSDPYGQSFRSPLVSETPRADTDFYGSGAPFGSSFGSETPRANTDYFGSSTGGETPRGETNYFAQSSSFKSSFGSETPRSEFNSFGFDGDHFGSVGPFGSSAGGETPRGETNYFAQSSSFKSSFGSETPRGEFDSFGFGGPFGSSFGSETPRRDPDTHGSSGPFKSTTGSEKLKGETDSWSAF